MASPKRHSSKPLDLRISELHGAEGVVSYKELPGIGTHTTLRAYNDHCLKQMTRCNHGTSQGSDWSAMYMQFTRDHVLGTVPYRWETTNEATLIAVTFHSALDIAVIGGEFIYDGSLTGADKAGAVKTFLGIDTDAALVCTLGGRNKLALVQETKHEWELVVPHPLLMSGIAYSEHKVALFRRHGCIPVTERWCPHPNGMEQDLIWEMWDEGCKRDIPDLETSWFRT